MILEIIGPLSFSLDRASLVVDQHIYQVMQYKRRFHNIWTFPQEIRQRPASSKRRQSALHLQSVVVESLLLSKNQLKIPRKKVIHE